MFSSVMSSPMGDGCWLTEICWGSDKMLLIIFSKVLSGVIWGLSFNFGFDFVLFLNFLFLFGILIGI